MSTLNKNEKEKYSWLNGKMMIGSTAPIGQTLELAL
jgi:hypothetical protein